ncbi:LysR family transcriptional regulator [Shewanella marisflavi]|uniref:LysR family transcriptional regulator n=2 Tax=Shewanella marisflavi TaxID=260364 RepID=A0AAC9TXD5_9GAMM|nr:LysR family transcriptional regulator [Shewanella marisflavi]
MDFQLVLFMPPPTTKQQLLAHQELLDPLLLRAFVAVADSGSFTRAAATTHLTQSTVSQQLKRLEQQLGYQVLSRKGRYAVPTAEGERLLSYARNILSLMAEAGSKPQSRPLVRLGVAEDFAGAALMPVLVRLREQYPNVKLEVQSGLSKPLYQAFQEGKLDVALIKQRQGEQDAWGLWPEHLSWLAASHWQTKLDDSPLPLVTFPVGGLYRNEMAQLLDEAGIQWQQVYSSNSLEGVLCAVAAGLGISLLPSRFIRAHEHQLISGLPTAAAMELALHLAPAAGTELQQLARGIGRYCDALVTT